MKRKRLMASILLGTVLMLSACRASVYGQQDRLEEEPLNESIALNTDVDILLHTEHQIYSPDIPYITVFITNNTEETIEFGLEFQMDRMLDGEWIAVPYAGGWNDIAVSLPPNGQYAQQIDMVGFEPMPKGTYRFLKTIAGETYIANFFLGDSIYSAQTPFGYQPLKLLPYDYSKEAALADGVVVITYDGVYENFNKVESFVNNCILGNPAMLRTMRWTVEGEPIVSDILYQYGYFQVVQDISRDSYGSGDTWETHYSFLNIYKEENNNYLCLSNQGEMKDTSEKAVFYIIGPLLTDEPHTVLLQKICQMEETRSEFLKEYLDQNNYAVLYEKEDDSLNFGFEHNGFGMLETITELPKTYQWQALFWVDDTTFALIAGNEEMKNCFLYNIEDRAVVSQYEGDCFGVSEDIGFVFAQGHNLLNKNEAVLTIFEDRIIDMISFSTSKGESFIEVTLENGKVYAGQVLENQWEPFLELLIKVKKTQLKYTFLKPPDPMGGFFL